MLQPQVSSAGDWSTMLPCTAHPIHNVPNPDILPTGGGPARRRIHVSSGQVQHVR